MICGSEVLIDAGPLIALYNSGDKYHVQIWDFFKQINRGLVTTEPCIAEAMYNFRRECGYHAWKIQNELIKDLRFGLPRLEPLQYADLKRIAELNEKYNDRPGDFADLSLVAISERLEIDAIITLDDDFDVYRRFRDQPFNRIFYPHT